MLISAHRSAAASSQFKLPMVPRIVLALLLVLKFSNAWKLGNYSIVASTETGVRILHTTSNKEIWRSATLDSFLTYRELQWDVVQSGGNFIISNSTRRECKDLNLSSIEHSGDTVTAHGGVCAYEVRVKVTFSLSKLIADDQHIEVAVDVVDPISSDVIALSLNCDAQATEAVYGLGHQYTFLNMKGKTVPIFLSEQGVGRGVQPVTAFFDLLGGGAGGNWHTTYTAIPFFFTNHGQGAYLSNTEYAVFDYQLPLTTSLIVNASSIRMWLTPPGTPLQMVQRFTEYSGRMLQHTDAQTVPEWVDSGAILGLEGGRDFVLKAVERCLAVDPTAPIAGVWLQDWTGERNFSGPGELPRIGLWWNWEVDSSHYPDWEGMIGSLLQRGIRTMTYVNPMVSDISKRGTPYKRNMWQEAMDAGYLVKLANGEVWTGYGSAGLVDFTNPAATAWFTAIMKDNMVATNVTGWMADFGEALPLDSVLHADSGTPALATSLHNNYPALWAAVNSNATAGHDDISYFMRSASIQATPYARMYWLGDQLTTWDGFDGLRSVVTATMSASMSGLALTHADVGGYTTLAIPPLLDIYRSKELLQRWAEVGAFSLMYRTHPGSQPNADWQVYSDDKTILHFFRLARVFRAWGFYRRELVAEYRASGAPVIRHMMLAFPNHSAVYTEDLSGQFLLGDQILVTPVLAPNTSTVSVWLPAQTVWMDVWTNATVHGNDSFIRAAAPIGKPSVYVRAGGDVGARFVENLITSGVI